jgi:two-component system phosphate regulon sensor histidine kinase PhoR
MPVTMDAMGQARAVLTWTRGHAAAALAMLGGPRLMPLVPVMLAVGMLWAMRAIGAVPALLLLAAVAVAAWLGDRIEAPRPAAPERAGLDATRTGEDEWRALVAAMPDAALVLDDIGHVLHLNASATELFPSVKLGHAASRTLRNPELMTAIDSAIEPQRPVAVQLVERIPVERRLSTIVTRLVVSEQAVRGAPAFLITFRDLSEQDKLAQMREDFVANASHELRTPLASLKGFLETLQGPARDDGPARERFLASMASQADRMSRLIDDLLSLSRIEMSAHVPPRGIVDLVDAARYAIHTLEPLAASSKVAIDLVPLDTPARIRGDRDQIVQVLLNLVQNAIVHGGGKDPVEVRIARSLSTGGRPPRLSVAVRDHGAGIAPEHLPRLTERFYRANAARSRARGGTGLGLAIVKHIVARHRGELDIASTVGQGSTFTVTFDQLAGAPEAA